jgi:hypothetical protein
MQWTVAAVLLQENLLRRRSIIRVHGRTRRVPVGTNRIGREPNQEGIVCDAMFNP